MARDASYPIINVAAVSESGSSEGSSVVHLHSLFHKRGKQTILRKLHMYTYSMLCNVVPLLVLGLQLTVILILRGFFYKDVTSYIQRLYKVFTSLRGFHVLL